MAASSYLKIAVPVATAVALTAVFVVGLLDQNRRIPEPPASTPEAEASASAPRATSSPEAVPSDVGVEVPRGDPVRPAPPEPVDYGGEFPRWNLGDLPENWDPAVARRLHELFENMQFDQLDRRAARRIEEVRKELRTFLERLGPDALPTLGKILNVEPDFVARRFVFRTIGAMGPESEQATWILHDYYHARAGDPQNRSEVGRLIEAMGSLRNDTSFQVLTRLSRHPEHVEYRDKLISALGEHPRREEAIDVFTGAMYDAQFRARNKAAQALGKVSDPDTIDDLYAAYEQEPVLYARQTILGSLGKIGEPETIPFLEEQARAAEESGVRLSAASAIRRIVEQTGDPYGLHLLRELARTEADGKVRAHIQRWAADLSS